MTSELLPRVERRIREGRWLPKGAILVVAVSGGLDSVLLLHCLDALAPKWKWNLHVAHLNHRLRGQASGQDERFVRRLAGRLGWPCTVAGEEIRTVASDRGVSVEMAARDRRHEFLAQTARSMGSRRIVLAHHGNDQVELFLLRILRGCGIEGLQGMNPVSQSPADPKLRVIRPFLGFTRDELVKEARRVGLRWREDLSNKQMDPLRNRVRGELLPLIQSRFQPGIVAVILRTIEILREEGQLVRVGEKALTECLRGGGWSGLPVAIQRRRILEQLRGLGVQPDFDWVERLRTAPETSWTLSQGRSVRIDTSGRVRIQSHRKLKFRGGETRVRLEGRSGVGKLAGRWVRWRVVRGTGSAAWQRHAGHDCEIFDADRVGESVRLRFWRPGDRFRPIGLARAAKLQDLLTAKKIPAEDRRLLLLAEAADGGLFWVEGLRIGQDYRVTQDTRRLLIWRWDRA